MEDETDGNFEQLTLANEEQGAHDKQQRGRKRAAPSTCLKPSEEACPHRSGSRKRSASDSDGEAFRDQLSVTGGERQSRHAHDTGMPRTSRGDLRERNDACTAFLFSFKPRNQRGQRRECVRFGRRLILRHFLGGGAGTAVCMDRGGIFGKLYNGGSGQAFVGRCQLRQSVFLMQR
jgi:hypothetical protein